jgi:AcrR family transcriptional regulator
VEKNFPLGFPSLEEDRIDLAQTLGAKRALNSAIDSARSSRAKMTTKKNKRTIKASAASGRGKKERTEKYVQKRGKIVQASIAILNQEGIRGMTIARVAEQFGFERKGINYYFANKDALSAACFLDTLARYEALIADAADAPSLEARIRRLISGYFEIQSGIARGEMAELARFDDLRALGNAKIVAAYIAMFRNTRALLDDGLHNRADRVALNARTHFLLQQMYWTGEWLKNYAPQDFAGAADRMLKILIGGIGSGRRAWSPDPLKFEIATGEADSHREVFLREATRLINEQGYRGASVDKIAARLDVTKGSFYHHLESKDELVRACFARTIAVMRGMQGVAQNLEGDGRTRLTAALASLVDQQLSGEVPLLRIATASVPEATRKEILTDFNRVTVGFGAMAYSGVSDGSLRLVDIQIAAEMITILIPAASELSLWLPDTSHKRATETFVQSLFDGLVPAE